MTVSYNSNVFTSTSFAVLFRLLIRWKGSIYKLVWKDLILYIALYCGLSLLYRFILDDLQRQTFEDFSMFCERFGDLIPVTFVLGFYVSLVVTRWWTQFETIPWPDSLAIWLSAIMTDNDYHGRLMRRSIMRYINLSLILTFRQISLPVKKRFPTMQHLVEAGFLMETEKQILERVENKKVPYFWLPLAWAGGIVQTARKEGRICNDFMLETLVNRIDAYRASCGALLNYDWVNVPLVYTQVVTLATYIWVLSTVMGRQFLDPAKKLPGHEVDMIFPLFTLLQLFFYMGWLKVAESLMNPFGEDDDDFETNWMIDRNIKISFIIVDEMHNAHPELVKDKFWEDLFPELPYYAVTENVEAETYMGGTASISGAQELNDFVSLDVGDKAKNNPRLSSNGSLNCGQKRGALIEDVKMIRHGNVILTEVVSEEDRANTTQF